MRHSSQWVRGVTIVLFAITSLVSTGCLVSSHSSDTRTGIYVAEGTFNQIKDGETTVGWVQATLGEPTSKSSADGRTIWKYTYTEKHESGGAVFLIFGGSSSSETEHSAFVEFKDGVVVNKWRN